MAVQKLALVGVLAVASVAGAILPIIARGGSLWWLTSVVGAGEAIGAALTLFVLSMAAAFLYVALRRREAHQGTALAIGLGVIAVMTALNIAGNAARAAEFAFSPAGCEYQVTFPEEPRRKQMQANGAAYVEVEYLSGDSLLRAFCMGVSGAGAADPDRLLANMEAFAAQNGLSNIQSQSERREDGLHVTGRGYKQIQGRWATYEYVLVVGRASMMGLTTAGVSETYPSTSVQRFIESLRRR